MAKKPSKSPVQRKVDAAKKRAGVSKVNVPKRTPGHPKKSHVVVAKQGDKVKVIRFGEQGAKTAGKPKKGESDAMKKKRASFKARHAKNIANGAAGIRPALPRKLFASPGGVHENSIGSGSVRAGSYFVWFFSF